MCNTLYIYLKALSSVDLRKQFYGIFHINVNLCPDSRWQSKAYAKPGEIKYFDKNLYCTVPTQVCHIPVLYLPEKLLQSTSPSLQARAMRIGDGEQGNEA